jgi:hypothetical protein
MRKAQFVALLVGAVALAQEPCPPKAISLFPPATNTLTPSQRLADFDQLQALFFKNYGAFQWKRDRLGFDLFDNSKDEDWRSRIRAARNDLEFGEVMVSWLEQFQDAHVRLEFPAGFRADLGIRTEWIDGKVLVTKVDGYKSEEQTPSPALYDELVEIDGVNVRDAMRVLYRYVPGTNLDSKNRLAAQMLTFRKQSIIPYALPSAVCSGAITTGARCSTLKFRKSETSPAYCSVGSWKIAGAPLGYGAVKPASHAPQVSADDAYRSATRGMVAEAYRINSDLSVQEARRPFFGELTESLRQTYGAEEISCVKLFCADFQFDGMYYGFVRIPSFDSNSVETDTRFKQDWENFLVNQSARAGIIVDLTGNPGGSIPLSEDLARGIIGPQFSPPGFRIRPTERWIQAFDNKIQNSGGEYTKLLEFIRDALVTGNNSTVRGLTGPLALNSDGRDKIEVNNSVLPKPIVLLVDQLSGSAAEYFAAIFQFNASLSNCSAVIGMPTIGAGGSVGVFSGLSYSGIIPSVTQSLMTRMSPYRDFTESGGMNLEGVIENIGIIPQVPMDFTSRNATNEERLERLFRSINYLNSPTRPEGTPCWVQ